MIIMDVGPPLMKSYIPSRKGTLHQQIKFTWSREVHSGSSLINCSANALV